MLFKNQNMKINLSNSKKFLISVIFILFVLSGIHAQDFKGGIMGGLVSSQVDGDSWAGYNKSSFTLGAFVNRKLNNDFGAQMEIRYVRKGALQDDTKKGGLTYYKSKLNYVEIPLKGRYYVNRFIFEGGAALGVLINSSEEDLYGEISGLEGTPFNRMEISGIIGFSYTVSENIFINFHLQYSMLPIRTNFSNNIQPLYYYQKYSFNNLIGFSLYYYL